MADNIEFTRIYNPYIGTSSTPSVQKQNNQQQVTTNAEGLTFEELLERELGNSQQVTFSKHAMQRVESRQVQVDSDLMTKLNDAVSLAKEKGIKDALIISNDASFIVNVNDNKVVTTLNNNESKNRIFTNIDGTVII